MCLMIGLACLELGLSPEVALKGATLGGARALRLQRRVGSIRLGKRCDLNLLDAESYLEIPYRFGVNLIRQTILNGRAPAEAAVDPLPQRRREVGLAASAD
jgi:imidazolonepropionase